MNTKYPLMDATDKEIVTHTHNGISLFSHDKE